MSVLAKIMQARREAGVFGVVAGTRLGGKSTLGGTLPGKTLMLQAKLIETGSRSAEAMAKKAGNELDIAEFDTLPTLVAILGELRTDTIYDNVYIDGLSAINEMKSREPDMKKLFVKNVWDAYREVGDSAMNILYLAKLLAEESGKNVFFTLAMKEKYDAMGNLANLDADLKGNMTLGSIKRLCPIVLCVRSRMDDQGKLHREILTKTDGVYSARIDLLLDDNNPGVVEANLAKVLELLK
jgi:hypothetical protein